MYGFIDMVQQCTKLHHLKGEHEMLICKVVGHVWATKKEEGLEGLKLMVVQEIDGNGQKKGDTFVAAECSRCR